MKVQVKVVEGEYEVEIVSEVDLDFELDVTEEEFGALIAHLSGDLVRLIYGMMKKKSQKIIVAPGSTLL